MSAPESVSIWVSDVAALVDDPEVLPLTTAACGLLKRYGPLVLHIIHSTVGGDGVIWIWLTMGEPPGGLSVNTYPSPKVIGPTLGRLVVSTSTCHGVQRAGGELGDRSALWFVTQMLAPSKATPIGVSKEYDGPTGCSTRVLVWALITVTVLPALLATKTRPSATARPVGDGTRMPGPTPCRAGPRFRPRSRSAIPHR